MVVYTLEQSWVKWTYDRLTEDADFGAKIIFSGEAHFDLGGYVNKQNCRIRDTEKRHNWVIFLRKSSKSSLLIFEEKWPNYASGSKSAPNSDSFWVRRLFSVCVRVFCYPTTTILLVYLRTKIKMSFI